MECLFGPLGILYGFTKIIMDKFSEQQTSPRGLLVDDQLKLKGSDNIYALGDCTFH